VNGESLTVRRMRSAAQNQRTGNTLKPLSLIGGTLLSAVGAIVFVSPLPFGFLLLLPGLGLLVSGSDTVAGWLKALRERSGAVNQSMNEAAAQAPDAAAEPLNKTEPC